MRNAKRMRSEAEAAQKSHWQCLGQLTYSRNLLEYMLDQTGIPVRIRKQMAAAHHHLSEAIRLESENNEFLNPAVRPAWRRQR